MAKKTYMSAHQKERIVTAIILHGFATRMDARDAMEHALGNDIYNSMYPEELRKRLAAIPEEFMNLSENIQVRFPGEQWTKVNWGSERPIRTTEQGRALTFDAEHPFSKAWVAYKEVDNQLCNERTDARRQAQAVVSSARTFEDLLKVWPEITEIVRPIWNAPPPSPPVPSVIVALPQLNKALGLPPQ